MKEKRSSTLTIVCETFVLWLYFYVHIQETESDEAIKTVIDSLDPISMEEGSAILLTAGVSPNLQKASADKAVQRLIQFYSLGMYR